MPILKVENMCYSPTRDSSPEEHRTCANVAEICNAFAKYLNNYVTRNQPVGVGSRGCRSQILTSSPRGVRQPNGQPLYSLSHLGMSPSPVFSPLSSQLRLKRAIFDPPAS